MRQRQIDRNGPSDSRKQKKFRRGRTLAPSSLGLSHSGIYPMFNINPSLGCIVDDVDPISEPLRRDEQQGTLATELVVNDQLISRREFRAAHKAWTNALGSISQTYKNEGP